MPVGLSRFLKQEAFSNNFFRLNTAQKCWMWEFDISALKKPIEIKLSNFERYWLNPSEMSCIWFLNKLTLSLYKPEKKHFLKPN